MPWQSAINILVTAGKQSEILGKFALTVLKVFSEDLVEERGHKTADELAHAMRLKDAFREFALQDIAALLHELYPNPSLTLMVIHVLGSYIEWIPLEMSMAFLDKVIACVV